MVIDTVFLHYVQFLGGKKADYFPL